MVRTAWFAAGAAAGVYGAAKARRAAYRLSGPGIIDQAAALGVGWRAFSADLRDGMREREDAVVRRLDPASAPALGAPPAGTGSGGLQLIAPEDQAG